jgi:hypothetical protein
MLQIVASLTDDSRGVIYNFNIIIIQVKAFLTATSVVPKRSFIALTPDPVPNVKLL